MPSQPSPAFSRRQFLQLTGSLAVAATVVSATVSACVPPPTAPATVSTTATTDTTTPQRGGILRLASFDDVTTLDPGTALSAADVQAAVLLYNTLVRRGEGEANAPIYPELAESWSMNEDATVHTFHLRSGVTFQHGTLLTSKDVEYSINRLLDPALAAGVGASLGVIEKIELVDELTINFQLSAPNVTLPFILGGTGTQIVPHDRTTDLLATEPAGTGPFILAERLPGEQARFQRNPTYWDSERPYLDEVQLLIMPEGTAQVAALASGTVDLLFQVGWEQMATLASTPDVKVLESLQGVYPVFIMRVDQQPFDDVRVRQALKQAVDRTALQTTLLQGRGTIGNDQPVGPGTPFWADVAPLAYDIEQAKTLLAAAGYGDGLAVTLTLADIGGPRLNDAAIAIQEMVKAAGITITLDKVPVNSYWAEKYMQAPFFVSWWPVFSDPDGVLPLAYSAQGFYNESGWSNSTVDELLIAGRGEQDPAKRKAIYAEVQQIISAEGGVLIPYFAPGLQASRANVQGHIPGTRIVYQNLWLAQG